MRTKNLTRALNWAEKNEFIDVHAKYYLNICLTLGTLIDYQKIPKEIKVPLYQHLSAHNELCELRDMTAKTILTKIKGQRI